VDNIRELIERSRFAPVQARWKVYVVDECHMLSTAAFNALLKTLEEPPPRVVFVLATTDPQRVLPTILSRCQRFDFRRIPLEALEQHLAWIAEQEQIGISPEALHVVAQRAQGGLRDAESLLDQLSLLPPPVEPQAVWELLGAVPEQELLHLAESLAAGEPLGLIEAIRTLLERGREPSAVLQGLAGLLRDLVLAGVAPDRLELTSFSPQFRTALPELARRIGKAPLLRWQAQLKGSEQQLRQSVQPRLWLEVLLLGLLAEPQARSAAPATVAVPVAPAAPLMAATASAAPPAAVAAAPAAAAPAPAAPQPEPIPEPAPEPAVAATPASPAGPDLTELWQQILAGLELPSTRMLLSQQAVLARLDQQRAVIQVAGNWMAMVQSRLPLLEKAVTAALGSPRQVMLEAGGAPPPVAAAPERPAPLPAVAAPVAPATPTTPTPAAPALEAEVANSQTSPPAVATPATVAAPKPAVQPPAQPALIDDQAKRLAEFFNGEVVQLDGPLPELDLEASSDQAA
jgi:DNA polymerase-3 subunit gamma/tau